MPEMKYGFETWVNDVLERMKNQDKIKHVACSVAASSLRGGISKQCMTLTLSWGNKVRTHARLQNYVELHEPYSSSTRLHFTRNTSLVLRALENIKCRVLYEYCRSSNNSSNGWGTRIPPIIFMHLGVGISKRGTGGKRLLMCMRKWIRACVQVKGRLFVFLVQKEENIGRSEWWRTCFTWNKLNTVVYKVDLATSLKFRDYNYQNLRAERSETEIWNNYVCFGDTKSVQWDQSCRQMCKIKSITET